MAPSVRIRRTFSGSVARKPVYMFRIVTISEMASVMVTMAPMPAPIHTMKMGPRAVFGSAFSTLVYCWLGSNLIHGDWIGSAVLVVLMLSIAFLLWKYQKQVLHLVGQLLEKRKQRNGNKNADLSESSRV